MVDTPRRATLLSHQGFLQIDNNAAERAIKPVALGRKNWLFVGSDRGADGGGSPQHDDDL